MAWPTLHFDPAPDCQVSQPEFMRLLGFPPGHTCEPRILELADRARAWFRAHANPWVFTRPVRSLAVEDRRVTVDGVPLDSPALLARFRSAGASGGILVAVCAGEEAELEARRLWETGCPDEYFFLDRYAAALVEHLTRTTAARLCAEADAHDQAVLPHYSPGYPGWSLTDQAPLVGLLQQDGWPKAARLEVLSSGQLVPKMSLVGLFGWAPKSERTRSQPDLIPCTHCSYSPCAFRRRPWINEACSPADTSASTQDPAMRVPSETAAYEVNLKALQRWAHERVRLEPLPGGVCRAVFRFDGSTCNNLGQPLAFLFTVTLGPRDQGFPILQATCQPAPDALHHRSMCAALRDPDGHPAEVAAAPPVLGQTLDQVLRWRPEVLTSGCLCGPADRNHKWRLVLQTIHYRLHHDPTPA